MKIALTGARGEVGQAILREVNKQGHYVFEINRRNDPETENPLSEHRIAEGTEYEEILKAFKGADAVIHVSAIPNPEKAHDSDVHNNNVCSSYNALRAAAELGIKRVSLASSVNAIGLEYSREPKFDYFPVDVEHPCYAEDSYSLSKWIAENQADSLCRRYEDLRIASFRMHEVHVLDDIDRDEKLDKKILWSWSTPEAVARACLLGVTTERDWKRGHEKFYCVGPRNTSVEKNKQTVNNAELAKKHYPSVPIKGDLSKGFFDTKKIFDYFGWVHDVSGDDLEAKVKDCHI